ncbi:hypothetical protein GTP44_01085 [Duganella sp. FT50W]|uniref:Uncharacterized protein n=1 Tax=Duganella lactea TaxID=2692173 RepID=A0A6L8MDS1_9BURK|nr:hypothetical protein [Duganella lactea]MYM80554.1 hypothetical protein [Duganella lactea]
MTTSGKIAAFLAWTVAVGTGAFIGGIVVTNDAWQAKAVKTERKAGEKLARKNVKATAVGVRTEQAQDKTDQLFQTIKAEYETDQQNNPAIGCVLDPVSLRRWNAANAGSDGAASGEPDDEVPEAATSEGGPERGEQPH